MGEGNNAHSTTTTLTSNHINDTVIASERSSRSGVQRPEPKTPSPSKLTHLFPETLHITPAILVELAPRLAPYMPARTSDKDWPAIVEAALFLSGEMGVNRTLWARACDVMGREYAAVALALVSTRPAEHFTSGPGGYFAGMLRKFEKNPQDLCLSRTLWARKNEVWGEEGHKQRRRIEQQRRIEMRTTKSTHPDLQPANEIRAPLPARSSAGSFVPVGSALPQPATAWPVPPAPPRASLIPPPADRVTASPKNWKPSEELREIEQRINAMLANPKKDSKAEPGCETPRNDRKS